MHVYCRLPKNSECSQIFAKKVRTVMYCDMTTILVHKTHVQNTKTISFLDGEDYGPKRNARSISAPVSDRVFHALAFSSGILNFLIDLLSMAAFCQKF